MLCWAYSRSAIRSQGCHLLAGLGSEKAKKVLLRLGEAVQADLIVKGDSAC